MRWVGETQLVATALPHEYWRLQTHTRNINFILVYFSVILFQRVKTTKQNITNAKRSIYFILDIRVVLTAVFMWISISWFMAEFPSVLDKNLWSHATKAVQISWTLTPNRKNHPFYIHNAYSVTVLLHMQVCTSLQTDNHASTPPLSFLHTGCPSCYPADSVKASKANQSTKGNTLNERLHADRK